jgi:hypothetical protein
MAPEQAFGPPDRVDKRARLIPPRGIIAHGRRREHFQAKILE